MPTCCTANTRYTAERLCTAQPRRGCYIGIMAVGQKSVTYCFFQNIAYMDIWQGSWSIDLGNLISEYTELFVTPVYVVPPTVLASS